MLKRDLRLMICKTGCLTLIGLLLPLVAAVGQESGDKVDFANSIKPIFENHCISCHGPETAENFRIDVVDEAMDYIEAGATDESDIYLSLVSDDEEVLMPPPDEQNPLSAEQIQLVKIWIDEGAEWPADVELVQPVTEVAEVDGEAPGGDENGAKPVAAKSDRVFNAIGSLHPAAVHLPIGLLLASGLFALFSLRGNFVMSDCAYYCLWLGTLGAILACISGWWFSPMTNQGTVTEFNDLLDQNQDVFWHRTSALVMTAFALLLALFAAGARNRDPDDGIMWKLGLIVLACGIGWVGHEGGELTHGKQHYKDLKAIAADLLPGVFGEAEEPAPPKAVDEQPSEDDVGKSSAE
jgi:hypothetical protein